MEVVAGCWEKHSEEEEVEGGRKGGSCLSCLLNSAAIVQARSYLSFLSMSQAQGAQRSSKCSITGSIQSQIGQSLGLHGLL